MELKRPDRTVPNLKNRDKFKIPHQHLSSNRSPSRAMWNLEAFSVRPDFYFQIAFTLVVSGIFFWQVWVAWKAVRR
ncbi:hypothetical protein POG22_24140 [Geitlerinema sp. CS-897]|nr:hypothetical protein [Geitlerinema sp. CS-897]